MTRFDWLIHLEKRMAIAERQCLKKTFSPFSRGFNRKLAIGVVCYQGMLVPSIHLVPTHIRVAVVLQVEAKIILMLVML